jgi:hypothetical protein
LSAGKRTISAYSFRHSIPKTDDPKGVNLRLIMTEGMYL